MIPSRRRLLIITGEQRSGTTLLARLLDAQRNIHGEPDFLHVTRLWRAAGSPAMNEPLGVDQRRRILASFGYDCGTRGQLIPFGIDEFETFVDFYRAALARVARRERVVAHKTTRAYRGLRQLLDAVPELFVVFMVRDPRAVAASQLARRDVDVERVVREWREGHKALRRVRRRYADRVLKMKYEDLITRPRREERRVTRHLGIRAIDFSRPLAERGQPWSGNSSFGPLGNTLDAGPAERPPDDLAVAKYVEDRLAGPMRKYGYVTDLRSEPPT